MFMVILSILKFSFHVFSKAVETRMDSAVMRSLATEEDRLLAKRILVVLTES